MKNWASLHTHTDLSLQDSVTNYKEYVDMCAEKGVTAIAFTEHGNIYQWVQKALYCESKGVKYIHGVEVYMTQQLDPKVRDNYHVILLAKNEAGIKEINKLVDISTQPDHVYYDPRISFDEFLNISDNVIKLSACLGGFIHKSDKFGVSQEKFYEIVQHFDYLEIQPHNVPDQIEYNKRLARLSEELRIPLIAAGDFHATTAYKAECRIMRKWAKKMAYADEDKYDLTFKSHDEMLAAFEEQNSLDKTTILSALEATNIVANSCEVVKIDRKPKYPILTDNDEYSLMVYVNNKYQEKVANGAIDPTDKRYLDMVREEFRVLKKLNMLSFMLFTAEMINWGKENNIPTCPCRGSVGGSMLAYITGITDVDPIKWGTYFSRFANEDRIELGDIDSDFAPFDREKMYNYIIDRFGVNRATYILAIGTVKPKGTIDLIGRAYDEIAKSKGEPTKYDKAYCEEIKNTFEANPEKARELYPEVFYYFDGIVNSADSQSQHPAGMIVAPLDLPENYGTFWNKDGNHVLQIDMEGCHDVELCKIDVLGLKNIGVIKIACELAGIKYPEAHEIDFEDENVYNEISLSPVGLFQFENPKTWKCLVDYKPKKLNDLSVVNAAIRPSGDSYRHRLFNHEINKNPSTIIDELLKDNNGYLIFQEDTIAFLQEICGLTGSEADNIRRAIGRKQMDRLNAALPDILDGYCRVSTQPREVAEEEAKTFIQILIDSASYQFGKNHSTGYSMIGYYCAYMRHYYPLEFVTALLINNETIEDLNDAEYLAKLKGIKINLPKWGKARGEYHCDRETNSIYKGVGSIKGVGSAVGDALYELANNFKFDSFTDIVIYCIEHQVVGTATLKTLTKIGYFSEFEDEKYLLMLIDLIEKRYKRTHKEATKEKRILEIKETEIQAEKTSPSEKIKWQVEYLGGVFIDMPDAHEGIHVVLDISKQYATRNVKLVQLKTKDIKIVKIKYQMLQECKVEIGDTIGVYGFEERDAVRPDGNGKFVKTGHKNLHATKITKL